MAEPPIRDLTELKLEKFPPGPLFRILCKVSYCDIVEASLINNDVRNNFRHARLRVDSFIVSFDDQKPFIEVKHREKTFRWTFYIPEGVVLGRERRRIGRFSFASVRSEDTIYSDHHDIEHALPAVFEHLKTIFEHQNAVIEELLIDLRVIVELRQVVEKFCNFGVIKRLVLKSHGEEGSRDSWTFTQTLGWMIKNLKTIEEMYVGVNGMHEKCMPDEKGEFRMIRCPQRWPELLKIDHLCLVHAEWITRDDLLNYGGKTAILMNHRLKEEDLNAFIKNWMSSRNDNLMWIEVRMPIGWNRAAVTDGIMVTPGALRIDGSVFCCCPYRRFDRKSIPIKYSARHSVVVAREDGQRALVSRSGDTFFFFVRDDGPVFTLEQYRTAVRELQRFHLDALNVANGRLNDAIRWKERAYCINTQEMEKLNRQIEEFRQDLRKCEAEKARHWIDLQMDSDDEDFLAISRDEIRFGNLLSKHVNNA